MNKKFMLVALMAALSTVGYAGNFKLPNNSVGGPLNAVVQVDKTNENFGAVSNAINGLQDEVAGKADANDVYTKEEADNKFVAKDDLDADFATQEELDSLKNQVGNNTAISTENSKLVGELKQENETQQGQIDKNTTDIENIETELENKVDKDNVYTKDEVNEALNGKVDEAEFEKEKDNIYGAIAGNTTQIADEITAREEADKNLETQINKNKEEQAGIDKTQNGRLDKVEDKNNIQDGRLDNIESTLTQKVDKAEQAEIDASQQSEIAGLAGQIGNLGNDILQNKEDQAAIDKSQNETIDGLNQQIGDLANNKADKSEVEDLKTQVGRNEDAIQGNTQQIVDLNNSKLDKEQYENDKLAQEKRDEDQDGKINNVSNRLESFKDQVNSDNAAQNEIIANNTQNIDDLKTENKNQQAAIDTNKQDIAANKDAITQNKNDIADLRNDYTQVNGRLSGLEKKVDNLDNKMNKGLSLMAAMNAVDFQSVQAGEMAIGAGVGHYGNAQSVALGVAYSPVEDLTVNAKYSVTAGDADSFAVGAGASYKFKVGR